MVGERKVNLTKANAVRKQYLKKFSYLTFAKDFRRIQCYQEINKIRFKNSTAGFPVIPSGWGATF